MYLLLPINSVLPFIEYFGADLDNFGEYDPGPGLSLIATLQACTEVNSCTEMRKENISVKQIHRVDNYQLFI